MNAPPASMPEFCKRVLSLLEGSYDSESPRFGLELQERPQSRVSLFHTTIADHNMRRNEPLRAQNAEKEATKLHSRACAILSEGKTTNNLNSAFYRETAPRSPIPLYIRNEEKDSEEYFKRTSARSKPLDMQKVQRQFSAKLEAARRRGEEKAKMRCQKMSNITETPRKSPARSGRASIPVRTRRDL